MMGLLRRSFPFQMLTFQGRAARRLHYPFIEIISHYKDFYKSTNIKEWQVGFCCPCSHVFSTHIQEMFPPCFSPGGGAIGQASSGHRVQLANAPKAVGSSHPLWTRHGAGAGLEFSPRPNSPIGVVRIQSPVYKESPRLLLKHPSHPQLHMSPNSGGQGHILNASSNSAHAPPGHGRFGVGSTSLAPGRTTSPPPQSAVANLPRQSHLIPNALATASMAAAATVATSGSQGTENSALDPTQPAMKSMIQGPLGPQMKQLPASQMQFQQLHLQQSLQHQLVHLVPPQETDDNVIRKPSSDITQVPSRRVWDLRSKKKWKFWRFV